VVFPFLRLWPLIAPQRHNDRRTCLRRIRGRQRDLPDPRTQSTLHRPLPHFARGAPADGRLDRQMRRAYRNSAGHSMRHVGVALVGATALASLVCSGQAADLPAQVAAPVAPTPCFASLADYLLASAQECPITWNGITLYGTMDVGGGYQTHGAPFNDVYPNG